MCCVRVLCVCVYILTLSRKVILNQTGNKETVTQAQGLIHCVCCTETAFPAQGSPRRISSDPLAKPSARYPLRRQSAGRIHFFFPALIDDWSRSRSRALSLPVRVSGKKLTDRRRWPAVTQHEVLILTRDIMSLQRYRPKSA